ncbi:T9SS type A sorting domain-containing protein [Fluviicola sp.]|uniref:T9SS type A sorting domain-containing protein n=1 Tax=Fluviicola sp. TaxID=1917219 RepID=UPI0031CFA1E8
MKTFKLLLFSWCLIPVSNAQNNCNVRTFITSTSLDQSSFTVLTYPNDLLDSLHWDFGDGVSAQNTNPGTGSASHQYASPGNYTVTLEQWGKSSGVPFHCVYSSVNVVYDHFTDSLCGGDFLMHTNGNVVTFSNTSLIHSPSFSSHPSEPLWDFGNGTSGTFINRIYDVNYNPGTYTACLYYSGYSFNDGGYMYNCSTCKTFTIGTNAVATYGTVSLEIFPNPAAEKLTIRSAQEIDAVEVYSVRGEKQAINWETNGDQSISISLQQLGSGMYYVQTKSNESIGRIAFVKE